MEDHERYMRMALRLAARGAGLCSPNPMVGAVLVKDGAVVATGWHRGPGLPHAEAEALAKAGPEAAGCDLYVNLEPCCHVQKKTPPCVPAIVSAGVRRVVVGMVDPNPAVFGRGIEQLRSRGVDVVVGVLEEQARRLNRAFVTLMTRGRPHVTLKLATTLDGRIATRDGSSRYISCEPSRRRVHRMRALSDCVMVGIGTALADDPLLLPRAVRARRPPLRVVVDTHARLSLTSRLVQSAACGPVVVAAGEAADPARVARLGDAGVEVLRLATEAGRVSMPSLLGVLAQRGCASLLVEGGAGLSASLLSARLVDQLILFVAPCLLADPKAIPWCADLGLRTLADCMAFTLETISRSGQDIMLSLVPRQV